MNQRAGPKLSGYFNLCCMWVFSISTKWKKRVYVLILLHLNFYLEERETNEGTRGKMHLQNKLNTRLFCHYKLLQHHFALNVIPTEKSLPSIAKGKWEILLLVLQFLGALFTVWRTCLEMGSLFSWEVLVGIIRLFLQNCRMNSQKC